MITGAKDELTRALGRWLSKHSHLCHDFCTAMCWRIEFQSTSDHTHRRNLMKHISHWDYLIVSVYPLYIVGKLRKSSSKYFFHIWGEVTQARIIRGIWGNAMMKPSYLAFSHLVINWGQPSPWWVVTPWAGDSHGLVVLGSIRRWAEQESSTVPCLLH